jgi:hypothetical protein
VTSLEKVLVPAGCDRSGEITEGKEVCDWTWTGSSVSRIWDILEYVLVGIRILQFSSEDEKLEQDTPLNAAEWGCAITLQRFGSATCVLPADVKSVSEKYWLHTYCCHSFLVCSALPDMPNLSAHSCALCNN